MLVNKCIWNKLSKILAVAVPDEMCKFILFVVVCCFSLHLSFSRFLALLVDTTDENSSGAKDEVCCKRMCVVRVYVEFVHI